MSLIRFRRIDKHTSREHLEKALRALEDALFFDKELHPSHSFWLVEVEGVQTGVIGFYRNKSVPYFVFSIYPEFRGGCGSQIFDFFYKTHCADSFCVKMLDEERFVIADRIYSKKPMRRYQMGKMIIYINGGTFFGFKVLLLELVNLLRKKTQ